MELVGYGFLELLMLLKVSIDQLDDVVRQGQARCGYKGVDGPGELFEGRSGRHDV